MRNKLGKRNALPKKVDCGLEVFIYCTVRVTVVNYTKNGLTPTGLLMEG
jgi:hypothetical protein